MWGKTKKSQEPERNITQDRLGRILGWDLEESGGGVSLGDALRRTEPSWEGKNEAASESNSQISSELLPVGAPMSSADRFPSDLKHSPERPINEPRTASEATVREQRLADAFKPVDLDSATQIQSELAGPETLSGAIGALAEHLTQHTNHEAQNGHLRTVGRQAVTELFSEVERVLPAVMTCVQPRPMPTDELHPIGEGELAHLGARSQQLLEDQAALFQERLSGIVNKALSQSEATVHRTVSRLEAYFGQAKQIESTMDESLANLTRKAFEAVHTQTKILEGDLSNVAERVGSQVTVAFEPVKSWIRDYRAQAEEVNSMLETSLTQFTKTAGELALVQTRLFEENIARISEHALSQTQQSLQNGMTQSREIAAHSLENDMTSLSERLQHSHVQSMQIRLDEMFEASRAKLENIQQQSGNVSTELLGHMRKESEAIAREFHDRFKSDAQSLEVKMVETIRGGLQKLTQEFSSIFDGAFA